MKKLLFIVLFGSTLFISSCTKEPVACFTVDKGKTVNANEEVQFDSTCSTDADSFQWNFGDGSNSGGAIEKHKYTAKGTYNVILTASKGSKSSTSTQAVTVQ